MSDTEKLQQVIALFENSGLSLMDAELEGLKVHLEKAAPVRESALQSAAMTASALPAAGQPVRPDPAGQPPADSPAAEDEALRLVRSPLVGIFYASRKEGGTPLVEEGMTIHRGDPLCLVEAMKTMNELTAPCEGVIRRILAEDGQMVEFDQPLFGIEETDA